MDGPGAVQVRKSHQVSGGRFTVFGLAIAAALVFGAFAAANASAQTPVFAWGGGWPLDITTEGGPSTLETTSGRKVECTADTGYMEPLNGMISEFSGALRFSGCTATGPFGIKVVCTSPGEKTGEITTSLLRAGLRYIVVNGVEVPGLMYKPESGETIASFSCGGVEGLTVRGSMTGELTPVGKWAAAFTLALRQSGSIQEPASYLSGEGCVSIPSFPETEGVRRSFFGGENFEWEQSGFQGTETIRFASEMRLEATECGEVSEGPITTITGGPSGKTLPNVSRLS